jgi:hypothetical protein
MRLVHAWVCHFLENCSLIPRCRPTGELKPEELHSAETALIQDSQKEAFPEEYTALLHGRELSETRKILSLQPRLDEDRLIRCGGRLEYAETLSYEVRHPIVLPRKGVVTKLIVEYYHRRKAKHAAGVNQLLALSCLLSTRYWIVGGREEIKDCERRCLLCQLKRVIAPLPKFRVTGSLRAFSKSSVDYGGPFITKQGRYNRNKRYLCLFTCMATRAVHLEMAYALDTDSFLNALQTGEECLQI